jgi:hypothetical protein
MVKVRERLSAGGAWAACRAELIDLAERRNEDPCGGLLMQAEYLITLGTRT